MAARREGGQIADAPLSDETRILRRIPPGGVHPNDPSERPESWRFKPKRGEDGISVDIWEDGNTPDDTIRRATEDPPPGEEYGVVFLPVGDVRELDLDVVRDPLPGNPHHAQIVGRFTDTKPKKLARKAASGWIKRPVPERT